LAGSGGYLQGNLKNLVIKMHLKFADFAMVADILKDSFLTF
jgi:hypothetical protein